MKNISEEDQLEAIKENGANIKYIKKPSKVLQLEVVRQNGYNIQYIKNPSNQVITAALNQNSWSITKIPNQYEKFQLIAIKNTYNSFTYIRNPTKFVCEKMIYEYPYIFKNSINLMKLKKYPDLYEKYLFLTK